MYLLTVKSGNLRAVNEKYAIYKHTLDNITSILYILLDLFYFKFNFAVAKY